MQPSQTCEVWFYYHAAGGAVHLLAHHAGQAGRRQTPSRPSHVSQLAASFRCVTSHDFSGVTLSWQLVADVSVVLFVFLGELTGSDVETPTSPSSP